MPASSLEIDAPDDTVPGYRPARFYEGWLLPVLLPVLALNLIGSLTLDLLMSADHLVIVNGGLTVADEARAVSWLKLALTLATWLLALTAGAVAAVGARRGRKVDPRTAVAVALRQFPVLASGLCVAGGVTLGALWVAAGVAGALGGATPGIVVVVGVSAALAVVGARLLLGVLTRVFGGSAWQLTRGRLARTAGVFLVGGIGFPLLAVYVQQQLRAHTRVPVLMAVLDAALLVGVVALQATLLARSYLQPRDAAQAALASADLDAVDARLASLAGRRPHWMFLGAAAMVLPMLLSAGVAVTNPYGVPSIRTGDSVGAVAAAWPAGQHPIIATNFGVRFCDTDLCDRYVERHGMTSMDGWSTTTIATVATATTTARTGLHITVGETPKSWQQVLWRCERAHCDHPERIPLDVVTGEAGHEVMAVAPNGRVLIVRDDRAILLTTPPVP